MSIFDQQISKYPALIGQYYNSTIAQAGDKDSSFRVIVPLCVSGVPTILIMGPILRRIITEKRHCLY